VREAIKRAIMITVVIICFLSFDALIDYLARHSYPALFGIVLYPIDIAGTIEYSVGIVVFYVSSKRSIEWLNTGTIACFAFSFVLVAQKLILKT